MQPRKYIYFSKVVWFREILKILVKEDHFLPRLQKITHFHRRYFQAVNEMNFLKGHLRHLCFKEVSSHPFDA